MPNSSHNYYFTGMYRNAVYYCSIIWVYVRVGLCSGLCMFLKSRGMWRSLGVLWRLYTIGSGKSVQLHHKYVWMRHIIHDHKLHICYIYRTTDSKQERCCASDNLMKSNEKYMGIHSPGVCELDMYYMERKWVFVICDWSVKDRQRPCHSHPKLKRQFEHGRRRNSLEIKFTVTCIHHLTSYTALSYRSRGWRRFQCLTHKSCFGTSNTEHKEASPSITQQRLAIFILALALGHIHINFSFSLKVSILLVNAEWSVLNILMI